MRKRNLPAIQNSIDDRLTHILSLSSSVTKRRFEKAIQCAIEWLSLPGVVVFHFEDLVGSKGRGWDQKQSILSLVLNLGISLTAEKWHG